MELNTTLLWFVFGKHYYTDSLNFTSGLAWSDTQTDATQKITYPHLQIIMWLKVIQSNLTGANKDNIVSFVLFPLLSHSQIEPIIEEGHESLVHHMVLYSCHVDLAQVGTTAEEVHGFKGHCQMNHPYMQGLGQYCQPTFFAWAIGGGVRPFSKIVSWNW